MSKVAALIFVCVVLLASAGVIAEASSAVHNLSVREKNTVFVVMGIVALSAMFAAGYYYATLP